MLNLFLLIIYYILLLLLLLLLKQKNGGIMKGKKSSGMIGCHISIFFLNNHDELFDLSCQS